MIEIELAEMRRNVTRLFPDAQADIRGGERAGKAYNSARNHGPPLPPHETA